MRMLNLAMAWRQEKSGTVTLAGTVTIPFAADRLRNADVRVRPDLPGSVEQGVLMVDHYDPAVRVACGARSDYRLRVLGPPQTDGHVHQGHVHKGEDAEHGGKRRSPLRFLEEIPQQQVAHEHEP